MNKKLQKIGVIVGVVSLIAVFTVMPARATTTDLPQMVKDINVVGNSSVSNFVVMNNQIYFRADDGINGQELWKSDGTEEGTVLVKDIYEGSENSYVGMTIVFDNKLYFKANNGIVGDELWISDGTTDGTVLFKDINPTGGSSFDKAAIMNNTLYFQADDGINGRELWRSDGTVDGTSLFMDINSGGGSSPNWLVALNNILYFRANDGINGSELWRSDGTVEGTAQVKDINPLGNSGLEQITVMENNLYFRANDGVNGVEMWKSDGTEMGTSILSDICPSGDGNPYYFAAYGKSIYFVANDCLNGNELWKSDGTEEGTIMVADIYEGEESSYPRNLIFMNNILFFQANDGTNGDELWSLETPMVTDTTPPTFVTLPDSSAPINITEGQTITTNPYIIKVKPNDANGIQKVEFYVDDNLICTATTPDADGVYSCSWDTSRYHSDIRVLAYDNSGNPSLALTRSATVDPSLYTLPRTGMRFMDYIKYIVNLVFGR